MKTDNSMEIKRILPLAYISKMLRNHFPVHYLQLNINRPSVLIFLYIPRIQSGSFDLFWGYQN